MVHKEWTEVKVFRKVFKIPDGVVLDLIKAEFKEEGSILTIIMPKQEKGIRGVGIEEVKEEEVGRVTAKSEREVVVADEFPERDRVRVSQVLSLIFFILLLLFTYFSTIHYFSPTFYYYLIFYYYFFITFSLLLTNILNIY